MEAIAEIKKSLEVSNFPKNEISNAITIKNEQNEKYENKWKKN